MNRREAIVAAITAPAAVAAMPKDKGAMELVPGVALNLPDGERLTEALGQPPSEIDLRGSGDEWITCGAYDLLVRDEQVLASIETHDFYGTALYEARSLTGHFSTGTFTTKDVARKYIAKRLSMYAIATVRD